MQFPSWPVFSREVRGFLRSRKAFICLFLFLVVLLSFLLSGWRTFTVTFSEEEGQIDTGIAGKELFYWLMIGQILMVTVLTPFLTAPAIAGEHERGTIALLFSSPVSLFRILIQKLISSMAFLVLLLIGAVPAMALCLLAGGLSGKEVAGAYLIIIGASFMYGAIGLLCSSFGRRVYEVYLLTFGLIILIALVLPYHSSLWHYITRLKWSDAGGVFGDWNWLSPIAVLSDLLFPSETGLRFAPVVGGASAFGPVVGGISWSRASLFIPLLLNALLNALVTALCIGIAYFQMRRVIEGRIFHSKNANPLGLFDSLYAQEENSDSPGVSVKSGLFEDRRNPAILLDQRVQWLGGIHVTFRLFYIALMISILTLPLASFKGAWIFFSLPYMAAALFTVPLAATSVSSERERNTLDMLLVTLLKPADILQAKFRTSFLSSLILSLALYLPGTGIILFFALLGYELDLLGHFSHLIALLCCPFLLICSLFFFNAISLFCSVKCRHSNAALVISALIILGSILLPLFCVNALQHSPFWFGILFILISPLGIVSTLFPEDSINVMGLSLDHALSSVDGIGFIFLVIHCVFALVAGRILLARAAGLLTDSSSRPAKN